MALVANSEFVLHCSDKPSGSAVRAPGREEKYLIGGSIVRATICLETTPTIHHDALFHFSVFSRVGKRIFFAPSGRKTRLHFFGVFFFTCHRLAGSHSPSPDQHVECDSQVIYFAARMLPPLDSSVAKGVSSIRVKSRCGTRL